MWKHPTIREENAVFDTDRCHYCGFLRGNHFSGNSGCYCHGDKDGTGIYLRPERDQKLIKEAKAFLESIKPYVPKNEYGNPFDIGDKVKLINNEVPSIIGKWGVPVEEEYTVINYGFQDGHDKNRSIKLEEDTGNPKTFGYEVNRFKLIRRASQGKTVKKEKPNRIKEKDLIDFELRLRKPKKISVMR